MPNYIGGSTDQEHHFNFRVLTPYADSAPIKIPIAFPIQSNTVKRTPRLKRAKPEYFTNNAKDRNYVCWLRYIYNRKKIIPRCIIIHAAKASSLLWHYRMSERSDL